MVETLNRYREPVAWLALAISAVYILVSLVRWGLLLGSSSLAEASRQVGGSSLSVVMVMVVVATVLSCVVVKPVTPQARRLIRLGSTVVGLAALIELVMTVIGLFGPAGGLLGGALEVLGALLEAGVKVAAAVLLYRTSQGAPEPVARKAVDAEGSGPAAAAPAVAPQAQVQAASWKADQAAGAVWTRAGDAASGAAANTWGTPGRSGHGWEPEQPALEASAPVGQDAAQHDGGTARSPWPTAGSLAALPDESSQPTQEAAGQQPGTRWSAGDWAQASTPEDSTQPVDPASRWTPLQRGDHD